MLGTTGGRPRVAEAGSRRPTEALARLGDAVLERLNRWDEAIRARWPFAALVVPDPGPVSADDSFALLWRPALLGLVAVLAITIGVAQQSSPFTLKMPGAWFYGVPAPGSAPSKQGLFFGLTAVYGGLLLLMRVWYGLARTLARVRGVRVGRLVVILGLWTLPLLVAPPLFSRDVYSYAAQGEMMSHHIDPYHYGPDVLGGSPFVPLVDPLWGNTPAPYGPLFLGVDGLLARLAGHHVLPDVVLLRLLELVGVGLLAWAVPKLALSVGRDPAEAFALGVLNPVVVLHFVGGAHNDALMLGLLAVGVALARQGKPVAGLVVTALATAVKAPAALGVLYIGWEWAGAGAPLRARARSVVTAGLVALGVVGVVSAITGLGWRWVLNLGTPGTVRSWLAPATGVGMLLANVAHAFGIGIRLHSVLSVTRVIGLGTAAIVGIRLLLRSERVGTLRAMGLTLLAVVVLGPVVQPWYLSWGLVLLAPVATGWLYGVLVAFSVASAFIGLPGAAELLHDLLHANPLAVAAALLALLFVLTVPLTPWDRRRLRRPREPHGAGPSVPVLAAG
jgi:alpha-1,6-mannosyltransferase